MRKKKTLLFAVLFFLFVTTAVWAQSQPIRRNLAGGGFPACDALNDGLLVVALDPSTPEDCDHVNGGGGNGLTPPPHCCVCDGSGTWTVCGSGLGDDLGSHIATQNLDLQSNDLLDIGRLGVGTAAPADAAHISSATNPTNGQLYVQNSGSTGERVMMLLQNNGVPVFRLINTDQGDQWAFRLQLNGFAINNAGSAGEEFRISEDGDVIARDRVVAPGGVVSQDWFAGIAGSDFTINKTTVAGVEMFVTSGGDVGAADDLIAGDQVVAPGGTVSGNWVAGVSGNDFVINETTAAGLELVVTPAGDVLVLDDLLVTDQVSADTFTAGGGLKSGDWQFSAAGSDAVINKITGTDSAGLEAVFQGDGDLHIEGSIFQGSSRSSKTGVQPLAPGSALSMLLDLPLYHWKYRGSEDNHVGPMAEDWKEATGMGTGSHLSPGDVAGLALAAVRDLARSIGSGSPVDRDREEADAPLVSAAARWSAEGRLLPVTGDTVALPDGRVVSVAPTAPEECFAQLPVWIETAAGGQMLLVPYRFQPGCSEAVEAMNLASKSWRVVVRIEGDFFLNASGAMVPRGLTVEVLAAVPD